jgi:photosystem II stability/assembly factor-like uncharacterized protein
MKKQTLVKLHNLFLLLFLFISTFVLAQKPTENNQKVKTLAEIVEDFEKSHPKNVLQAPENNFRERRPDKAHEDREEHFERWKWFAERHLNPDGTVGSVEQIQAAYEDLKAQHVDPVSSADVNSINDPNWQAVGPMGTPANANPWNQIVGSGRVNAIAFNRTDANNIWLGTSGGGLWKTWTRGQLWINISLNIPTGEISDIAIDPYDDNIVYVATGDWDALGFGSRRTTTNGIYKTTDGGTNWWRLTMPQRFFSQEVSRIVVNQRENAQLLVASEAGILKSTNSGTTWQLVSPHKCSDLQASQSQPNIVYAVSGFRAGDTANFVLKSMNFGTTWDTLKSLKFKYRSDALVSELEYNARIAISATNPDSVYVLTGYVNFDEKNGVPLDRFYGTGYLYLTTNGGSTWQKRYDGATRNLMGWEMGSPDDTQGQAWYSMTLAVDPRNSKRVFVGGVNHWGSDDAGANFSKVGHWSLDMGPSLHADHHIAKFNPITNEYYVGTDGGLFASRNLTVEKLAPQLACLDTFRYQDGSLGYYMIPDCYDLKTDFTDLNANINNTEFYGFDICTKVPNVVIAGAQDNGTSIYRNGSWAQILGADGMIPLIHPSNPKIYYASWQQGQMAKTIDGGADYIYGVVDTIQDVDEGPWVTQYTMSPTNPNEILTARTDVWRTINGMISWTRISNFKAAALNDPSKAKVVTYAPSNTNHIWVGKNSLFKTTNGGTSWTKVTTPFNATNVVSIAINAADPNTVWVTLVGFTAAQKVYKTTNGGTTWTNVGSNLPNTPINCILLDDQSTNEAVYIGTDLGVFYRNSTMTTWMPYDRQMPIVIVNALKIQPQQRLLYAATYGRGVWRSQLRDNILEKGQNLVKNTTLPTTELSLSPNPSVGTLNIQYLAKDNAIKLLEISDLYGRSLITKTQFNSNETIDLKNLSTGTYFVKLHTENGLVTQRFVLQR